MEKPVNLSSTIAAVCPVRSLNFSREAVLRSRIVSGISDPTVRGGACIAVAELVRLRHDHEGACDTCAAAEQQEAQVAA